MQSEIWDFSGNTSRNARNIAYNSARDAVIRSARRYHDVAISRPVLHSEWVEAWYALGADIEALNCVEREATEPKDAT